MNRLPDTARGPYRDDAAGVQARLADLRATWLADAALVTPDVTEAIRARAARIGAGAAATLAHVLMLGYLLAGWMFPTPLTARPLPPGDHPFNDGDMAAIVIVPMLGLIIFIAFTVLKIAGKRLVVRASQKHLERLLAGRVSTAPDPVRELQLLVNQTPRRLLATAGARLEAPSMYGHVLGAAWPGFCVATITAAAIYEGGHLVLPYDSWFASLGAMAAVQACAIGLALTVVRHGTRSPAWLAFLAALVLIAVAVGCFAMGSVLVTVIAIQVATLAARGFALRWAILRERAALC